MQDPIHTVMTRTSVTGGADAVLLFIRDAAVAAGWIVDEYDTTPDINTSQGGDELYIHTNSPAHAFQSYFSLKAFRGASSDQSGIVIYCNTGYDVTRRVDNQPGMFARHASDITNAAPWTQIFSGLWDGGGINAFPGDHGRYQTPGGAFPTLANNVAHLNCYLTTAHDKLWAFYDNQYRTLGVFWYTGNILNGFVIGKVYYDFEGSFPDNSDAHLLAGWMSKFSEKDTTNPPWPNSLGCSRTSFNAGEYPFAIIRNKTKGSETWPVGTPDGNPMVGVGSVVQNAGKLEASDGINLPNTAGLVRPDETFTRTANSIQNQIIPNPRITLHYEAYSGSQHRRGVARCRNVSRINGGAFAGSFQTGGGSVDWADSRFFFPWYFAPCANLAPGDTITNGTRRYVALMGNRQGTDLFASHRWAGLAFRISDL